MKRFFIIWPFWCALIIGINIWNDATNGLSFNWRNFGFGVGIMLFGGVVYTFSRLIFKFTRAYVEHDESRR